MAKSMKDPVITELQENQKPDNSENQENKNPDVTKPESEQSQNSYVQDNGQVTQETGKNVDCGKLPPLAKFHKFRK